MRKCVKCKLPKDESEFSIYGGKLNKTCDFCLERKRTGGERGGICQAHRCKHYDYCVGVLRGKRLPIACTKEPLGWQKELIESLPPEIKEKVVYGMEAGV
jgi:hypothetical protein